jgi:hypothetical protein
MQKGHARLGLSELSSAKFRCRSERPPSPAKPARLPRLARRRRVRRLNKQTTPRPTVDTAPSSRRRHAPRVQGPPSSAPSIAGPSLGAPGRPCLAVARQAARLPIGLPTVDSARP